MTSYVDKYLDDLYLIKIRLKHIFDAEGISRAELMRDFSTRGLLTPHAYYQLIDTGFSELDLNLKRRYNSIFTRCNGNTSSKYAYIYKGLEYMPVYKWVEFCNDNKELLIALWEDYLEHDKDIKYAVSIDRKDNELGYTLENVQFVTQGFNSWKRNARPIKVTFNNEDNYFLSAEEGSRFYGIRRQSIGDILRGRKLYDDKYVVIDSTIKEVLANNKVGNLKEYYEIIF